MSGGRQEASMGNMHRIPGVKMQKRVKKGK